MLDVFDPPYMQRALLAGLVLALPLGLVGTWVMLRSLAFFSHAVGVGTFPGVVVGLGVPAIGPFAGALAAAALLAGTVAGLERDERIRGGAVTGLALSTAMALGAVLLTSGFGISTPVDTVLFGSLLAVSDADVTRAAVVALAAVALIGAGAHRLQAATFDRGWAGSAGARPGAVDAVLLAAVAATVVVALPVVGSLLVSGLLVLPAATARLLARGVFSMLALAVAFCAGFVVVGLAVAHELDAPPGAVICATGGVIFTVAVLADRALPQRRSP